MSLAVVAHNGHLGSNPVAVVPEAFGGSVSLNHVLELLVAAQREILDTQRDLIRSDVDGGRNNLFPPSREEELALIQRYQENSLGLLKAAAEGLVQVIMHWSPSLDADADAVKRLPMRSILDSQSHQQRATSPRTSASSSLLVATLAEVEDLQSSAHSANARRQLYQLLFHWLLFRYRTVSRRLREVEGEAESHTAGIERLSDAIKLRSVLLVERIHQVQRGSAQELYRRCEHALRNKFFSTWHQSVLERRKFARELAAVETRHQGHRQRDMLFQTFSVWHRSKLCRRIQDLQQEVDETHHAYEADRSESITRYASLQSEVDRLTHALALSNERVLSLESELQRSEKQVEELTAHLDVSCGSSTVSLKAHRLKVDELENVFRDHLVQSEKRAEEVTRRIERDAAATHRWIKSDVIPSMSAYIEAALHHTETLNTLQLSCMMESLRARGVGRIVSAATIESEENDDAASNTSSTVASYSSSSGDSVDRGELLLKLSHLTQEVESLRAEKRAAVTYTVPPSLVFHSPLMQSGSFEHNGPLGSEPDLSALEGKLKRTRRRLASLLHAKNKTILACGCVRKWMAFALRRKEKGKLDAVEQAHRHWVQANVEERDRALLALDERVDDEHRSIQAAMNESRASVGRSLHLEASPSPLRGTLMSNLSFEGTYGDPAPSSTSPMYAVRRWPPGYRAASPRLSLVDPPRDEEHHFARTPSVDNKEAQTEELQNSPTTVEAPGPTMLELENEELHVALSTSHGRENALMQEIENALREVEDVRVANSELRSQVTDQDERLLVTYIQLCNNDIVHAEANGRLSLEYNELRLRLHALQSLFPSMISTATTIRDQALTEWTRSDSRNHRNACLAADALSNSISLTLRRDYWDAWQRSTMIRRFEALSELDRQRFAEKQELRDADSEHWMMQKISSERHSLEERYNRDLLHLQASLHQANSKLADATDQSEIRFAQSKQIIRQLRNDAATGTLIASRLGVELVEYCASSAFHKWMSVVLRKRSESIAQRHGDSSRCLIALSSKQHICNARITEDVIRTTFAKWALLNTSTKELAEETQSKLLRMLQEQTRALRASEAETGELQQRVASMHLEATEILRPKISELEKQLADHDGTAHNHLSSKLEELRVSLTSAFNAEIASIEYRHQQYCEELRESESLSAQELLEMQRAAFAEELKNVETSNASRETATVLKFGETLCGAHSAFQEGICTHSDAIFAYVQSVLQERDEADQSNRRDASAFRSSIAEALFFLRQQSRITVSECVGDATSMVLLERNEVEKIMTASEDDRRYWWNKQVSLTINEMVSRETLLHSEWFGLCEEACEFRNVLFKTASSELDELVQYGRFLEETTSSLERRLADQVALSARQAREHENALHLAQVHSANVSSAARIALADREHELETARQADVLRLTSELDELRSRYMTLMQRTDDSARANAEAVESMEESHRRLLAALTSQFQGEIEAAQKSHAEIIASLEKRYRQQAALELHEFELEMKSSAKHQLQSLRDQSATEFSNYRTEIFETLQKLNSATTSLEQQSRDTIAQLEGAHRIDLEHLRSECQIRVQEEVSLQLEHQLEAATLTQQRTLAAHQQAIARSLQERQQEHDREIELLKANFAERTALWEHLVQQRNEAHAAELRAYSNRAAELEQLNDRHEAEKKSWSSNQAEHESDQASLLRTGIERLLHACEAAEIRERQSIEECHILADCRAAFHAQQLGHLATVTRIQQEHQHRSELNEERLRELTSQLVRESVTVVNEMRDETQHKYHRVVSSGLQVIQRCGDTQLLCRTMHMWRQWSLIEAFRADYKSLRAALEAESQENSHLRHLIAKALEHRRASSIDEASPITIVSPLSDVQRSAQHRSPSPTRVAEAMMGFSSHVNDSIARSDDSIAAVNAIVQEVDQLIERGKKLRATHKQPESRTQSF